MVEYLFKNNAVGKLNAAIGASDTSFALQSGQGALFPSISAGQAFHIVVEEGSTYEWMTCTARSSDTLTVTRSGSPQSFSSGSRVELRLYEDALNQLQQEGIFRSVTSDPDGSLAADYSGEEVLNTNTNVWWKHCTGTTWKAMNS